MRRSISPKKSVPAALAVIALAIAASSPARLAADQATDKVDKLFAAWDKTTSPGAALAVIKDGKIVYERGYGMARLENGAINKPDTVFDIGSVSKQFTAACAAILIREGKLRLEDDIRKYLPEMPAYDRPITVDHLLHHTSGLRNYCDLLDLAGFREDADSPTVAVALEIIRRQKGLNHRPGEEYLYTNSGFFLLGQIIERVSGKSLNEFAQERIFRPLGMTKTLFLDDHNRIVKDRATGYVDGKGGLRVCMSNWEQTGDGSVCTTVRDLYLWDQALYTNALGQDVMDRLQTRGALNSGMTIDYAWGLYISAYKGLKIVRHSGSWAGFRAPMVRFPEQRFSVIVLANLESISPSALAYSIADIYLAGLLKEPPEEEPGQGEAGAAAKGGSEVTVAPFKAPIPAELSAYAGTYVGEELLDARYIIAVAKDGLVLKTRTEPQAALKALAPDKFMAPGSDLTIEFMRDRRGKVTGFELGLDRAVGILFKRVTR